jgi:hypothetical protein
MNSTLRVLAAALLATSALATSALAQQRPAGPPPGAGPQMMDLPAGLEVLPLPDKNVLILVDQRSRQVSLCRYTIPAEAAAVPGYACTTGFSPFPK